MRLLTLLLALCLSLTACSESRFFADEAFRSALVGYQVRDVLTGEVVCELNADKSLTPASITKLITTATAIELLGDDFRFATLIATDGELMPNGVLNGNLFIIGGGDPTLGSAYYGAKDFLSTWADSIAAKGIRCVRGAVVVDVSIFDNEPIPTKWSWEDMGNYYAAGVYALSAYDNTIKLNLATGAVGSTPKVSSVVPEVDGLCVDNRLICKDISFDSAYFYGAPMHNVRVMYGAVPAHRTCFTVKGDLPNPPQYVLSTFVKELQRRGISISGGSKIVSYPCAYTEVLFKYYSPSLVDIIRTINYRSNNLFAEHLMKYLSHQPNRSATLQASLHSVRTYWEGKGIDFSSAMLYDGSGLSLANACSPALVVDLLTAMLKSEHRDAFLHSLPVAGKSGTVASFLKGRGHNCEVRVKSGSCSGVQCYAGYIDERYAFAIMVNNFSCSRAMVKAECEQLVERFCK